MNEELKPYGTDSTDPPAEPLTREEQYLSAIAGVTSSSDIPPKPLTRVEEYLNKIVENGGGGGGGTTDYTQLSNKPQINSVTLTGNKSLSDIGAQATINNDNKLAGSLSVLTGYAKAETAADLAATDTVNQAFGKIEKRVELEETNISSLQSKTFIESDNLYDNSTATYYKSINSSGQITDNDNFKISDFITIPYQNRDNYLYLNSEAVSAVYNDYKGVFQICLYDTNKTFIKRIAMSGSSHGGFNETGAVYMRLMIGINTPDLMVVVLDYNDNTYNPNYVPYGGTYTADLINEVQTIIKNYADNDTETPLQNIIKDGGMTRIFRSAGVVGDSLSSGCMEYKDEHGDSLGYDRYKFSWLQQMKGICGFENAYNFSAGGLTAKKFWTTTNAHVLELRETGSDHKCDIYFIALGVNDIADTTLDLGTIADIENDSSETFYGYYARIIKLIKTIQPKARIFLVGLPNDDSMTVWGSRFTNFKIAISNIANYFDFCYYIDLYQYDVPYTGNIKDIYFNGFHENALGYLRTAYVISSYVDWYVRHNYTEFREVGFIGTDLHYYTN